MADDRPGLPLSGQVEPSLRRFLDPIVDVLARVTGQSLTPMKPLAGTLGGDKEWRDATSVAAGWVGTDAKFCRDENGIVWLRGNFTHPGPLVLPQTIYTLPAGYRPSATRSFACPANDAFAAVRLNTAGEVVLRAGAISTLYLDGIHFTADGVMPRASRDAVNAVRTKVNELISRLQRD